MISRSKGRPLEPERVRLLATDYDGTLAEGGLVTGSTWVAIERWRASGRRVVLVTGRELDDLASTCPRLDLFDRVVLENGGTLFDPASNLERPLAAPPSARFVEALRASGVEPISVGRVVVAAWQPHESTIRAVIEAMGLPLRVVANKRALMVLPEGVDKASGLLVALDELGVPPREVVGVGDAENDLALFDASGLAVAVANALPEVKARADFETLGARGVGVAELIDELLAQSR